jgi:hypothetical protein
MSREGVGYSDSYLGGYCLDDERMAMLADQFNKLNSDWAKFKDEHPWNLNRTQRIPEEVFAAAASLAASLAKDNQGQADIQRPTSPGPAMSMSKHVVANSHRSKSTGPNTASHKILHKPKALPLAIPRNRIKQIKRPPFDNSLYVPGIDANAETGLSLTSQGQYSNVDGSQFMDTALTGSNKMFSSGAAVIDDLSSVGADKAPAAAEAGGKGGKRLGIFSKLSSMVGISPPLSSDHAASNVTSAEAPSHLGRKV